MTFLILLVIAGGIALYAYRKEPSFAVLVDGAIASVKAKFVKK